MLSVLCKGHLTHPDIVRHYRVVTAFASFYSRHPGARALLCSIRSRYVGDRPAPLGPVGILLSDGLRACGIAWRPPTSAGSPGPVFMRGGARFDMFPPEPGRRNHLIRDALRDTCWAALRERRVSLCGLSAGSVDLNLTNEFWSGSSDVVLRRCVLLVIAGAVPTSRENPLLLDAAGVARPGPGDPSPCPHCGSSGDSTGHVLWGCPRHQDIRDRPEFAAVVGASRVDWLPCLALHGIIPSPWTGCAPAVLHRLLGSVVMHRLELDRALLGNSPVRWRPWDVVAAQPAHPWPFPYSSIVCFRAWRWGLPLFRAFADYFSRLQWSSSAERCTWLELTVDFELFSGLRITVECTPRGGQRPGLTVRAGPTRPTDADLTFPQRYAEFCRMFILFGKHCKALRLDPAFPCETVPFTTILARFGFPRLGGLLRRPLFLMDETAGVLDEQVLGVALGALDPVYPPRDVDPLRWGPPPAPSGSR